MPRLVVLGVSLLTVAGCGAGLVWDRPGLTDAEFRRDDAECRRIAEVETLVPTLRVLPPGRQRETIELAPRTALDFDRYRQCLESRGYRQVPE